MGANGPTSDEADLARARAEVRSAPVRLRLLGTPRPAVDFVLAAVMLAFGIGAVALARATAAGWIVLATGALAAAYFAAVSLYGRRHRKEIARYWSARRRRIRASVRRHPLRWLITMPVAAAADAALHWNRHEHRSTASTAVAAAVGGAIGLIAVVVALRRARSERTT